ncbi:hypothetical protein SKAU_G00157680 [Synaphobranchus kaupii]|uniref:Uncharacterized protein n=1 Tax=Synaphobranchus kaupii TaxID=118154 RepID=A0A9Q1FHW3_SYNKA|nr:hypothetical protein SKAU_G00157680 [Synaphobranchus kaupii]
MKTNVCRTSISLSQRRKVQTLERQGGSAVKKLERMGELIYSYGAECFGVVEKRKRTPPIPTKSRRQQEIDRLIMEKRQLKKLWTKAPDEEKEGINLLQTDIKARLIAENLRKKCRKK